MGLLAAATLLTAAPALAQVMWARVASGSVRATMTRMRSFIIAAGGTGIAAMTAANGAILFLRPTVAANIEEKS